jgi:hypothetical protein
MRPLKSMFETPNIIVFRKSKKRMRFFIIIALLGLISLEISIWTWELILKPIRKDIPPFSEISITRNKSPIKFWTIIFLNFALLVVIITVIISFYYS